MYAVKLLPLVLLLSCTRPRMMFDKVDAAMSGITFNNRVTENDSINPIDQEFMYNGGGVAGGDFNRDGLPDLYFTGSMVSNELYLNKGGFKFNNITKTAGAGSNGKWCNGVSVVDINNDGWPDIYVCASMYNEPARRTNMLLVNQGLNNDGIPVFKDMAAEYGLADSGYCVQAAFFDYDHDGDLDMFLVRTKPVKRDATEYTMNNNNYPEDSIDMDKLYRNDWDSIRHHGVFRDVSLQAGIHYHGYGLGVAIADLNVDGWPDVYVTNDFLGSDQLYLNQHNGTFTNTISASVKHCSQNAMGNDVADINNDGLPDIFSVDMNPEDNFRKKKNMSPGSYYLYQMQVYNGYSLQYVKNTLQLNMGNLQSEEGRVLTPLFSDIAYQAGVAETDWSWSPAFADVNNDGLRDLLITNGYPKDVTDHDFAVYRRNASPKESKQHLLAQIPQIKISNYAFENTDGIHFKNMAKEWGLSKPSFSYGAVCVDLDNDGDLDYVVNNVNDAAFVYRNNTNPLQGKNANFINISFNGPTGNRNGLGAKAEIYYAKHYQAAENSPCRGYLSCGESVVHFGLGPNTSVDSLIITWPGGEKQVIQHPSVNKTLSVQWKEALSVAESTGSKFNPKTLLCNITKQSGIIYTHSKQDVNDFDAQPLLMHKLSEYGPALACGDLNADGLDDICVGGTGEQPPYLFFQKQDGSFTAKALSWPVTKDARRPDNLGILLFDADGDGDLDLYLTSGGNRFTALTKNYQDQLLLNNGHGGFTPANDALPQNYTSKSCIRAADIDNDGDLDLFIGGRVTPGRYPELTSSFIYRNDSKNGVVKFTDITAIAAPLLHEIGLVSDALFTDIDNDGQPDLLMATEWMSPILLKNNHGHFTDITRESGLGSAKGWWNSLVAGDFDGDGDIDYIAGNIGQNSYYSRCNNTYPARIYSGDFNHNGGYISIPAVWMPDAKGKMDEFPVASRDEVTRAMPFLKKRFLTYGSFGKANIASLLTPKEIKSAVMLEAYESRTSYLENLGNGHFSLHPLPAEAQVSAVYGMVTGDFNQDGKLDVLLSGNDFGDDVSLGRNDALNGLLLLGNGKNKFSPLSIGESGVYIPGNGRAVITLSRQHRCILAASQNKATLELFAVQEKNKALPCKNDDLYALIHYADGSTRKEELYWGNSFLSQSARMIMITPAIISVDVVNNQHQKRVVYYRNIKP